MKTFPATLLAVAFLAAPLHGTRADQEQLDVLKAKLARATRAEMPAVAAHLVARTPEPERDAVAEQVIMAAVQLRPAAAAPVVGAIARRVPSVAAVVARTAIDLQPDDLIAITRAAATSSSQADRVVETLCQLRPHDHLSIAIAATKAAPDQRRQILAAVGRALPGLQPHIEQQLPLYRGQTLPVRQVLEVAGYRRQAELKRTAAAPDSADHASATPSVQPVKPPQPPDPPKPPRGPRNYSKP